MSAATADRNTTSRPGHYQSKGLAAFALIFAGTLCCYNASGLLVPAANTSGFVFAGVSRDQYDNSAGAASDVIGEYSTAGQFKFTASGLAATDVGARLYVTDDQTLTKTAGNVYVGRLVEYISATECWVEIEPCSSEATDTATLTAHLNGGANKHDATEIDYERANGSKKNIQAGSDAVEAALTDLDDAIGLRGSLTTTAQSTIVAAINEVDADLTAQRRGTAVILNGAATVIVAVGAPYDGKPAIAVLNEADGSLHILHCVWDGSGNLTITLSGNATADRTVAWIVDGR